MHSQIERWGSSAAVHLPDRVLAQAQLSISSQVHITVSGGSIIIARADEPPLKKLPFSEDELLAGLDAYSAHADEVACPSSDEFEI